MKRLLILVIIGFAFYLYGQKFSDRVQHDLTQQRAEQSAQEAAEIAAKTWVSPAGLRYGPDPSPKYDTRIDHVMAHTKPDPSKPKHSLFVEKDRTKLLALIDEAWKKRGPPNTQGQRGKGRDVYEINMNKKIGTKGERTIRVIVEEGTSDMVTAYPFFPERADDE